MDGDFRSRSRRSFLGLAGGVSGAAALTGWSALCPVPASAADTAVPPGFPRSVPLSRQAYRNWSGQIALDGVWTATPGSARDIVDIVNWAYRSGYRIRARGMQHNWSPVLLPADSDTERYLLVDTTRHLTGFRITDGTPPTVTVQTGATVDALLAGLERAGYGLLASTAAGALTIGGVLAIGGHGTGVPTGAGDPPSGGSFGSIANLVLSLTAVVWDAARGAYTTRTFHRDDPEIGALLVHLGRSFVTEVTLQVAANQRVRCVSRTDVDVEELFAPPGSTASTFDMFLSIGGRVEALWFPFTRAPWLKVWQASPVKPASSRLIEHPYPYPFANRVSQLSSDVVTGVNHTLLPATPMLMSTELGTVTSGLAATRTRDVWGWSRTSQLYAEPSTLRIVQASWAVLTARRHVQRVVHDFFRTFRDLLDTYRADGRYPVNVPLEIRVTGLDQPGEVAVDGAVPPLLSAARPRPDHPEWDTCVWLSPGTLPGTPHAAGFFAELERWIWRRYSGQDATVRPEWSKGWAHGHGGAWTDATVLGTAIPAAFRAGQPAAAGWDGAVASLHRHDPHQVFTNPFLNNLLR